MVPLTSPTNKRYVQQLNIRLRIFLIAKLLSFFNGFSGRGRDALA